jgi:hypothetical protein
MVYCVFRLAMGNRGLGEGACLRGLNGAMKSGIFWNFCNGGNSRRSREQGAWSLELGAWSLGAVARSLQPGRMPVGSSRYEVQAAPAPALDKRFRQSQNATEQKRNPRTPSARPKAPKSLAEQSHMFTSTIVEFLLCDRYGSRNGIGTSEKPG